MRSDAAPALSVAIAPTWSALHVFDAGVDIKNGATSSGVLRLYEDSDSAGGNFTSITVPASLGANVNYTLPGDDGDPGEQLQTDGNGLLTWEAAGAGGGLTDGDKGDIVVTGTGTVWTLDAAVTRDTVTGTAWGSKYDDAVVADLA